MRSRERLFKTKKRLRTSVLNLGHFQGNQSKPSFFSILLPEDTAGLAANRSRVELGGGLSDRC